MLQGVNSVAAVVDGGQLLFEETADLVFVRTSIQEAPLVRGQSFEVLIVPLLHNLLVLHALSVLSIQDFVRRHAVDMLVLGVPWLQLCFDLLDLILHLFAYSYS